MLVTEGPDDLNLLAQVANDVLGTRYVRVVAAGGVDDLLKKQYLQARLAQSDLERIGFVLDADHRPRCRWKAMAANLSGLGYSAIPDEPPGQGVVLDPTGAVRLGVWMMPDNARRGALETLLVRLIPNSDDLLPLAISAVRRIPVARRRFGGIGIHKAWIRTWLAWQGEPGPPFGTAWRRGLFEKQAAAVLPLIQWLRDLFVCEGTPPISS